MLRRVKGKRGWLLLAAACSCLLVLRPAVGAGPSGTVGALQADQADLAARTRAAVLELYSLDARLGAAERHLSTLHAAERRLAAQRAALARELRVARVDTRLSQNQLALRLRFLYLHGSTSSLDVLMGAKSLEDALTQLDEYDRVAAANASVLLQVQSAHRHLTALRHTIAARTRALAETAGAADRTVTDLQALRSSRAAYIGELERRRSLDAAKIAALTEQAQAAAAKSQRLAAARTSAEAPAAPETVAAALPAPAEAAPGAGRTLTVSATAYSLPGYTSSGLPVGWGVAAVDPSVIPFGTRFVVPGYGVAVAADTGTAIIGDRIDLWFPTYAQAAAWGRHTVTIVFSSG